jgi:hypothetical protein
MSDASVQTFRDYDGEPPTRITTKMTVKWVREYGPATMHDLYDNLDAKGLLPLIIDPSPSKQEQRWNEYVRAIGTAAKKGFLSMTKEEHIDPLTGCKSHRSVFRYLEVQAPERPTKNEALRAENAELKVKIQMLETEKAEAEKKYAEIYNYLDQATRSTAAA